MDALRELERAALKTKQSEVERVSRLENWQAGQNADLHLYSSGQRQPQEMDLETFLRLAKDAGRVESMMSTLKTLLDTAQDLQKTYGKLLYPVASKLSKGIASLPDDIILLIFTFAAIQDRSAKTPVYISHVSRKFRALALGGHDLWTILHYGTKTEGLKEVITRSGVHSEFHVVIEVDSDERDLESSFTTFMDVIWKTAPRWKALAIYETGEARYGRNANYVLRMMHRYDLQLPRLHELRIDTRERVEIEEDVIGFEATQYQIVWKTPSLRVLCSENYIPSRTAAFSSLSSFSFMVYITSSSVVQLHVLFAFLTSFPTISHFELQLHLGSHKSDFGILEFGEFLGPRVTSFKLHLPNFSVKEHDTFVMSFMKALKLPSLKHLSLSIDFDPKDLMTGKLGDEICTSLLLELGRGLLPDPAIHNRLDSLDIELRCEMPDLSDPSLRILKMWFEERKVEMQPRTFTISLDRIPNVSSLTLTMFPQFRTRFINIGEEHSTVPVPSRLRELRLRRSDVLDGTELRGMIQSLKSVGAWQSLELVELGGCMLVEYEESLSIVGKERLHYWHG